MRKAKGRNCNMKYTVRKTRDGWILSGKMMHKDGCEYKAECEFTPSEDMITAIERIEEAHVVGAK